MNKKCACIHSDVCGISSNASVCKNRITLNFDESYEQKIESLKAEVKRLKDKYEPDRFFVETTDEKMTFINNREFPKDWIVCLDVRTLSEEQMLILLKSAEKLCAELNEKARGE